MGKNKRWTFDSIPGQSGRTVIVTGANSGIGYETARMLAAKNARVILACRNISKGQEAVDKIRRIIPGAEVEAMHLDLGSLASVREFAEKILNQEDRLDLLINNAGVMMPPYGLTKDGFELQFGTNHLGHFALTGLLLPLILKTKGSRVVNVSSAMHKRGKIQFEDLNSEKTYNKPSAYGQSKLANLLFTYELQRKLTESGSGTLATASHPGWTRTNLQRHTGIFENLNPLFGQKPGMGALPTLRAACAEDAEGGDYYGPGGFMEMSGPPVKVASNERSHDPDTAGKLWEVSEKLTGVTYRF